MIKINQLKISVQHNEEQLKEKIAEYLHIKTAEILQYEIARQSIDARKKPELFYSYSIYVSLKNETKVLKRWKGKENQVCKERPVSYQFPVFKELACNEKVVIVGMGPAGLFCAYYLAKQGVKVLLLERGKRVEERQADVDKFWSTGSLSERSNVQFGEGGAGTFSDGKLNTLVKDKEGRNSEVLKTFVKFGAKKSICYEAKPHIGTDVLVDVVRNMRNAIEQYGGEIRFECCMTDILIKNGQAVGVIVNDEEEITCSKVVLAIGHSARDTFQMLYSKGLQMEPKAFAVGFRVEHPQNMINESQYGQEQVPSLGAAPYKVTAKGENGRAVYSFCMCPGGYVVNASSEIGRTAVNGMSYSKRDGKNANSAIIVAVTPDDFGSNHPLAGIEFQRKLEEKAFEIGKGKIPVQRYGDFKANVKGDTSLKYISNGIEEIEPSCKGQYEWADISQILPFECNLAFIDGMESFGKQIKGFNRPDAILSGVESRTSSPVRITRNEQLQAEIKGIYPCGEGAGYAGGITSAAMDGIRVAEKIAIEIAENMELI